MNNIHDYITNDDQHNCLILMNISLMYRQKYINIYAYITCVVHNLFTYMMNIFA